MSLMTIFLAIGGLGFLFLLASLIIGDIFDAIGFEFGAIGVSLGSGVLMSSFFGILGGAFFGALVFYFGRFLYRQQSSSSVSEEDLIGRSAQVVVGIPPNQIGQITCRVGEERVEKLARTRDGAEIKAGAIVRIESITGDAVIVSVDNGERLSLFSENS